MEAEIDADQGGLQVQLLSDTSGRAAYKGCPFVAEFCVVVFYEDGPVRQEHVFEAATKRTAYPSLGFLSINAPRDRVKLRMVVAQPSAATLNETQERGRDKVTHARCRRRD